MFEQILITAAVFALFFVFVGVRIILKKDGTFRGSCSSQNITGDDTCSICGKSTGESCKMDEAMEAAIEQEKE